MKRRWPRSARISAIVPLSPEGEGNHLRSRPLPPRQLPGVFRCRVHDHRRFAHGVEQLAPLWKLPARTQYHPRRHPQTHRARRQEWVIRDHRSAADHDGVHTATKFVDLGPARFATDPFGIASVGGDAPVQAHRPLRNHPRRAGLGQLQVWCVQLSRRGFACAHVHCHPRRSQHGEATAGHSWKWIEHRRHHTPHPGRQHRIGTRWRFPVVAARFQRNVKCAAACPLARRLERMHLGVRPTEALVPPLARHRPTRVRHHRPNHRVRLHEAATALGKRECSAEMCYV